MNVAPDRLKSFVQAIFSRAGSLPPEAERIAHYLVESNLAGHDSHGVIRVPHYINFLKKDMVRANQSMKVVFETEALAVVDGQFGFGQVIGEQAMRFAIAKCEKHGVLVLALRNCGHLGRIGEWPLLVARTGKISLHFVNTSGLGILAAPFGGIDRRLSANPIAVGIPVKDGPPIILDISTCAIAEGKIKVAFNKGESLPPGSIIDAEGRPSQDPKAFYANPPGAILPFGGHKGYGLSVVTDILAGALTGSGSSNPHSTSRMVNGLLALVLDPERFPAHSEFAGEVRRFIDFVKSSRTTSPDGEILMPGELEERTRARRLKEGIDLDDVTWGQLQEVAAGLGAPR
jgi:uncharacterized oxidoreductase